MEKFCLAFGYPKIIQTDNGTEFVNGDYKLFCENNKINFINSSPKHPSTNGAIEIAH